MFNGIIRDTGHIEKIEGDEKLKTIAISCPNFLKKKKTGDSIAVDGACLTVKHIDGDIFFAEIMPETMAKTIVNNYKAGDIVNLEQPLKIGDFLDGHYVSGHVDFTAQIMQTIKSGSAIDLTIKIPAEFKKYFALKGSVTVNGVSLTISQLQTDSFIVSLIPQTAQNTNLGKLLKNNFVNIEIDIFSRYLESLLNNKEQQITYEFLRERNFI